MPGRFDYLRSRIRLTVASALLGLTVTLCAGKPPGPGVVGLAEALGEATSTQVSELSWEPQGAAAWELLLGRGVLFIGKKPGEPYPEVYRALVRLSPEGRVLGVHRVRNLSQTDLGRESGLRAHGQHAVFVSESEGGHAILTVLDLAGERSSAPGIIGKLELALSRFLRQGTMRGLGQCDVRLPAELEQLSLHQRGTELVLGLDGRQVALDLRDLFDPNSSQRHGLEILRRTSQAPPLAHFAADIGRLTFGAAAVAGLEEFALSTIDRFTRTGYRLTHQTAPVSSPAFERRAAQPRPGPSPSADVPWPPADLPSPWPKPEPGEGHFTAFGADLMPRAFAGSLGQVAPPLVQTFVRPDPERPYARALLVAIDTARLELGLRGGYEDPRPRTGPPGSGQVPDDPRVFSRIVATFNGAFKTTHGSYGMKAEGRVLIPAVPGAATLRIDANGAVGLGTFRPDAGGVVPAARLEDALAYRQNLDLLLEGDRLLPTGRLDWGDHLVGSTVVAERSGLCVRGDGHLVYVWSKEATARSLARAMLMGGCLRGMHLDMNPGHCTFAAHRIDSFQPLRASARLLSPEMRVKATRYLRWSPKDFFYLAYRDAFPHSAAADQLTFAAAPGQQPEPGQLPAIVIGQRTLAGLDIEVERIDLARVGLALAVGSSEDPAQPAPTAEGNAQAARSLAAWALGHATLGSRPGLSQGERSIIAMDRRYATLVLPAGSPAFLKLPGDPIEAADGHDSIQLDLLARDGALLDSARRITTRRTHGAVCIDESGYLWLGRMTHDTPGPLAQVLLDLGCRHVLEADRGSQSPATVERAGHADGLAKVRAASAIVGVALPLRGRAYAF
jgi:hypothetical protein